MQEIIKDLFSFLEDDETDATCITTNGIVKKNGEAVMGAGVAKECAQKFPDVPKYLGTLLSLRSNVLAPIGLLDEQGNYSVPTINKLKNKEYKKILFSFPTKHHWKDNADLNLIKKSALTLVGYANELNLNKIVIPAPGCGLGNLDWQNEVKPTLSDILDNRFVIVFKGK